MATTDALTGATSTSPDKLGATQLTFKEKAINSTLKFNVIGDPGVTEVGDSVSYKSNLYNSNNVFVGTKDTSFIFTKQQKNGDFIALVDETFHLPGGDIFTQGSINTNALTAGKTQKIDIINGTGIYDDAHGTERIKQPSPAPDMFDITLKIN